jgi:hypothetical protein
VKDSEFLNALKTELEKYNTFSCKLKHETITATVPNNGFDTAGNKFEPIFNRLGFCNHSFRSFTINCAHTTAGFKFKDLLKRISNLTENFQGDIYTRKIDELLCGIYLLDHKRGALEKEYVLSRLSNNKFEYEKIKKDVSNIINNHSNLVAELELLRKKILTDLNQFTD